ncbi:hypothetical protein EVG20_g9061 [Dentipellis fragilis]|uniref:Uncharacterized protein n=1 Tax=Dentipellis fragilis TaxID=205917 RepID=A0A4Y9Y0Y6_9AGAM|nr:hypothetical protein EVG20_g9061 [Dentipellis fragilis]
MRIRALPRTLRILQAWSAGAGASIARNPAQRKGAHVGSASRFCDCESELASPVPAFARPVLGSTLPPMSRGATSACIYSILRLRLGLPSPSSSCPAQLVPHPCPHRRNQHAISNRHVPATCVLCPVSYFLFPMSCAPGKILDPILAYSRVACGAVAYGPSRRLQSEIQGRRCAPYEASSRAPMRQMHHADADLPFAIFHLAAGGSEGEDEDEAWGAGLAVGLRLRVPTSDRAVHVLRPARRFLPFPSALRGSLRMNARGSTRTSRGCDCDCDRRADAIGRREAICCVLISVCAAEGEPDYKKGSRFKVTFEVRGFEVGVGGTYVVMLTLVLRGRGVQEADGSWIWRQVQVQVRLQASSFKVIKSKYPETKASLLMHVYLAPSASFTNDGYVCDQAAPGTTAGESATTGQSRYRYRTHIDSDSDPGPVPASASVYNVWVSAHFHFPQHAHTTCIQIAQYNLNMMRPAHTAHAARCTCVRDDTRASVATTTTTP